MLKSQPEVTRRAVDAAGTAPAASETAAALVVSSGRTEFHFDKTTGRLAAVRVNGDTVPFANGPRAVPGDGTMKAFTHRADGDDYIVEATYDGSSARRDGACAPEGG